MTDLAPRVDVHVNRYMPLRRIWRYVGYDEPNYTYTPNGAELLGKLGRPDRRAVLRALSFPALFRRRRGAAQVDRPTSTPKTKRESRSMTGR